ncbi:hypothetical protein H9X78_04555 [Clostridium saudiense]|nr:hypothetical protein [Clostridium saudiense]
MDIEKQLSYIATELNSITAELKILNKALKPKKADSPEYYRILNPESTNKKGAIKKEDNNEDVTERKYTSFGSLPEKKEKNLSLAFIESSVSKDYLMQRLSFAANAGKGLEVSNILNKYEAIRFTDLKPRYYKDVLKEVEVLINDKTTTRRFN